MWFPTANNNVRAGCKGESTPCTLKVKSWPVHIQTQLKTNCYIFILNIAVNSVPYTSYLHLNIHLFLIHCNMFCVLQIHPFLLNAKCKALSFQSLYYLSHISHNHPPPPSNSLTLLQLLPVLDFLQPVSLMCPLPAVVARLQFASSTFIHSFNKFLLSSYFDPGITPGTGELAVSKVPAHMELIHALVGEGEDEQIHSIRKNNSIIREWKVPRRK